MNSEAVFLSWASWSARLHTGAPIRVSDMHPAEQQRDSGTSAAARQPPPSSWGMGRAEQPTRRDNRTPGAVYSHTVPGEIGSIELTG